MITSDTTNMTLTGKIIVTYKLTNVGTTKLRVLEPQSFFLVHVVNLNNTSVEYRGPAPAPPAHPTDKSLFVLAPGRSRSEKCEVRGRDWAVELNRTYKIVSGYYAQPVESTIDLPYWSGKVMSNEIPFTVVP
jgi:hypothetical protein